MGENDAHPLTEEQLDALVDELQDRLGDSTARKYGRRGVLAALGVAALGTGSASAQASGTVGTASNPVDVEGYDVTASNSFTDAAGVQHTGELADISDVGAAGQWQEVNSGSNIEPIGGETIGTGSEDVDVGSVNTGEITNVYDHIISQSDDLQAIFANDVSSGDSVFVESGTHKISTVAPIPSNVLVDGSGYDSVIEPTASSRIYLLKIDSNTTIRNIRFNDPGNAADDRTTLGIVSSASATNNLVAGCYATGRINFVQGQGWQNCAIVNNLVNTTNPANKADPNLEGVALVNSNTQDIKYNTISNNSFRFDENGNTGTDTAAIELDQTTGTNTISGNAIHEFPNGIQLDNGPDAPDGITIIGNNISNVPQTSIQLRGPQTNIDDGGNHNTVIGNVIKGGNIGVLVNSRRTVVSGNIVVGTGTGIQLSEFEAPDQDADVVNIQSNYLEANPTGIDVQSGVENYLIGNNYVNNASTGINTTPGDGYIHGNYVQSATTPYALAAGERRADNEPPAQTETKIEAERASSLSITAGNFVNIIDTVNTDTASEMNASNQFVPEETGFYLLAYFAAFNGGGSSDRCEVRVRDTNANQNVIKSGYSINAANFEVVDATTVEKLTSGTPYEFQARNIPNGGSITPSCRVRVHRFRQF